MKFSKHYYIVFLLLVLYSCNPSNTYYEDTGGIFNTSYSIKYEYSQPLTQEIIAELNKFDNSLNPFKKGSIIDKVNKNQPVEVDSFFIAVFNRSEQISSISNGMFDITCSPLINAWGFGFQNMDSINAHKIDSLKEFVGYEKIWLDGNHIKKSDERVQVNMSAIAKGSSVDVIANLLESFGIDNYMCEIGGEIRAKGINPHGECWRIGIDKPNDSIGNGHPSFEVIIQICDKAVASSGNYRNYYIKDGKKYSHTINPTTGYPSSNAILATTVIANDCMSADGYATTFMLTDSIETKKIALEEGLEYYIIYSKENGELDTFYSKGFKEYIIK